MVLKCRHKESGEIVAIKKFKSTDEEDESTHKTILREIKILKLLRHENVVQLKEAFRRKGRLYLVFEYVEKNLLELLEEKTGGLQANQIRALISQLCVAIEYCHRQDIIHRDIKPENLLVSSYCLYRVFQLKLCDFGFARTVSTKGGNLTDYVATRWYRSPELLIGGNEYGKPLDMWSIGCIMAEMIDGQPLFPGESEIDQLYLIQKTLGSLTNDQQEIFQKNPRYIGLKFPEFSKLEKLEKRFFKVEKPALNFLERLLTVSPVDRMTAGQALAHPYLGGSFERPESLLPVPRTESAKSKGRYPGSVAISKNKRLLILSNAPTDTKKGIKSKEEHSLSPAPLIVKENQATNPPENSKTNKSTTNKDNFTIKLRSSPFNPEQVPENKPELRLDRQRSKEAMRIQDQINEFKPKKRKTQIEDQNAFMEDIKFSPLTKQMIIKKKSNLLYPGETPEYQSKNLRSGIFNRYLPKQPLDIQEEPSNQLSARQLPNIYSNYQEKKNKPKAEDPDLGGGPNFMCIFQPDDYTQFKRHAV